MPKEGCQRRRFRRGGGAPKKGAPKEKDAEGGGTEESVVERGATEGAVAEGGSTEGGEAEGGSTEEFSQSLLD